MDHLQQCLHAADILKPAKGAANELLTALGMQKRLVVWLSCISQLIMIQCHYSGCIVIVMSFFPLCAH